MRHLPAAQFLRRARACAGSRLGGRGRRGPSRRAQARLCPHPADPGTAHPPREGNVQHHHQPDAVGARGPCLPLVAWAAGAARTGGDLHGPCRIRKGPHRASACVLRTDNIQGVCRTRRTACSRGHPPSDEERHSSRLSAWARLPGDGRRLARNGHRTADDRGDRPPRGGAWRVKLLYEKSVPGRRAGRPARPDLPVPEVPADLHRADLPRLPELAEPDLLRHFTELSTRNFGIDTGFYPLGSCTMKHNPRVNERLAALPGFRDLHPYQEEEAAQGALELMWRLQGAVMQISGPPACPLPPPAGAAG